MAQRSPHRPPATDPAHADARPWVVLKFGGTSVSRRARWDTIGALARTRVEQGRRVLVVVSALGGVTNQLQAIADGDANADALAAEIVARHRAFAAELDLDGDAVLGRHFATLAALLGDPRRTPAARPPSPQASPHGTGLGPPPPQPSPHRAGLGPPPPQPSPHRAGLGPPPPQPSPHRAGLGPPSPQALGWQAELLALGELLSSTLGHAYLAQGGTPIAWCDAREWLASTALPNQSEWAIRLCAFCDTRAAAGWQAGFAAQGGLLITQGFIARAPDGGTALLGRGGSDTSAACFGALLGAERVEIWTDVPGMFSANPRRVPEARLLTNIDYDEAQEIATTGAKVLHPRAIAPCREARVPIRIGDTDRPDLPGTTIGASAAATPGVKAISTRRGLVLVSMETVGMWQQVGFLADVFEQFRRHGLSVDMLGSSETNVTVSLDPSDNLVSSNVLEALCADLAEVCRVKVIAPCSAVTLVGRGMRSLLHKLSDVLAEFGRERVHLISQSSNDLNLTFVVAEELADEMLPRLHELLIQAHAMPVQEEGVFGPSWRALDAGDRAAQPPPWWRMRRDALLAEAANGTPRYVYDLATVRTRAAALAAIPALDRRLYALKANPHPAILRALYQQGFGLECVSAGELEHAFASVPGLDPERVLFTPSFAPRAEYAAALQRGVWLTVDSIHPLQHWPELFRGRSIWLRIDPGFGRGHHEKVRTGGRGAKFGLAASELPALLDRARALDVRVHGLHAHLGSGITDPAHWGEVLLQLASLAEGMDSVAVLDLGGGLAVPSDPQQPPFDLDALGRQLAELKSAYPRYALWMEPGRYLVAEAGVLLLAATQVVEKEGVLRIGADGGMNALLRPALYNAWHEIVNLSRLDQPDAVLADVVGPVCESGDVLGRRRRLPATREGDVLLVATAGAYGAVMASTYNLRALPAEVVLDD